MKSIAELRVTALLKSMPVLRVKVLLKTIPADASQTWPVNHGLYASHFATEIQETNASHL
tara:strand:+ start:40 stop:219 length:180 start_codon:yes stop_codon:yes gene_type:complete